MTATTIIRGVVLFLSLAVGGLVTGCAADQVAPTDGVLLSETDASPRTLQETGVARWAVYRGTNAAISTVGFSQHGTIVVGISIEEDEDARRMTSWANEPGESSIGHDDRVIEDTLSEKMVNVILPSIERDIIANADVANLKWECHRCSTNVLDCRGETCVPFVCTRSAWWYIKCFFE